ncbi:MAG: DUF4145 domain-containing protein [Acidobacteria bacterium]|jgi:hypothetical protein|nr:DUF4145 domain-containing protein [Acidobacteriota bacterium]
MKCPYCNTGIKLIIEGENTYRSQQRNGGENGIKIIQGFCSECNQFIVLLEQGKYRWEDDAAELADAHSTEIIYPKFILRVIANDVPQEYRNDFNESNSVLSASPKASAALSRRLLQRLLREKYKIVGKKDLSQEIEEFVKKPDIPIEIKNAVDAIRNIGNFAAHPNKHQITGEIVDVEAGEAEWLLDVLEELFDVTFVQPALAKIRKDKLNNKLAAFGKPSMK